MHFFLDFDSTSHKFLPSSYPPPHPLNNKQTKQTNKKKLLFLACKFYHARLQQRGESLYEVLGVARTASASEVKRAYYRGARLCHPDKTDDAAAHARFQELKYAYEVLQDGQRRAVYDKLGYDGLLVAADMEEEEDAIRKLTESKPWIKALWCLGGVVTVGYGFACCFCCCFCNCCCGHGEGCAEKLVGPKYMAMYRQAVQEAEVQEVMSEQPRKH